MPDFTLWALYPPYLSQWPWPCFKAASDNCENCKLDILEFFTFSPVQTASFVRYRCNHVFNTFATFIMFKGDSWRLFFLSKSHNNCFWFFSDTFLVSSLQNIFVWLCICYTTFHNLSKSLNVLEVSEKLSCKLYFLGKFLLDQVYTLCDS